MIEKSIKDIWTRHTLGIMFADAAFVFTTGFLQKPAYDKITEIIILLGDTISKQKIGILAEAARPFLYKLAILHLILGLAVLATYILTQGTAWAVTRKITGIPTTEYITKFAKITLPYYAIFCILYLFDHLIYPIIKTRQGIIQEAAGQTFNDTFPLIYYGILILLLLLAYTAYAKGKHSAKEALRQWKQLLAYTALITIVLLALEFILQRLPIGQVWFAIKIILLLIVLAWHRTAFIRTLK